MAVGSQGVGSMNVTNGGVVNAANYLIISDDPGGLGTVSVSGVGSAITVTGETDVGDNGHGTLNISAGGVVNSNGGVNIADSASGTPSGSATVSTGGTWNAAYVYVAGTSAASGSSGTLTVRPLPRTPLKLPAPEWKCPERLQRQACVWNRPEHAAHRPS